MTSGTSSLSLDGAGQAHTEPIKFLGKGARIPFLAVITSRTINIVINK